VPRLKSKSSYRRGYAVAILVGFGENNAFLWRVYSKVVKPEGTVQLEGQRNSPKDVYNFHEAVINALRPTLKEGVRSIILVSQPRTPYSQAFADHIRRHHNWLTQGPNKVALAEISGFVATSSGVGEIVRNPLFKKLLEGVTSQETKSLLEILESKLASSDTRSVLYSIEDIEKAIIYSDGNSPIPEFLLLTNKYLATNRQKNRIQRLLQIAANKRYKTRVVDSDSPAGKRLTQLGGIVCLSRAP